MIVLLFAISAAIIGTAAMTSLHYADAINDVKAIRCGNLLSDASKCLQKDMPFLLPFPWALCHRGYVVFVYYLASEELSTANQ